MLILGDSITLGATEVFGDQIISTAPRAYVHDLHADLPGWKIDCDAALYRNTSDAARSLPAILDAHRPDLLLVMLGGNDADLDWKRFVASRGRRSRSNVSLEQYGANLEAIVSECRAAGVTPVLTDVPSFDLAGRLRWLEGHVGDAVTRAVEASGGGQSEVDGRCQEYNAVVTRAASVANVPLCRWAAATAALPVEQRFGRDYVHPGAAAHRVIAAAVLKTLRSAVGAARPSGAVSA